jgi:hypothetical protein
MQAHRRVPRPRAWRAGSASARSASSRARAAAIRVRARGSLDLFRIGLDDRRHGGGRSRGLGGGPGFTVLGRLPFVHLAHDRARALRRALVLRARHNLLELAAVGDPLDRGHCGIPEFAVEGDAEQLGVIVQPVERGAPHRFVHRVTRDRSERVTVGHPRERGLRRRLARGVLGDADERLRIVDLGDGRQALALAHSLEHLERDIAQHRYRLRPHVLVRIVFRHGAQRRRIHQLRDSRAPHARVRSSLISFSKSPRQRNPCTNAGGQPRQVFVTD